MLIGSLMLFESSAPFMKLSLSVILPAVFFVSFFFVVTIRLAVKAYRSKPATGSEGLVGSEGIANTDITREGGMISLHGEIWKAQSDDTITKGNRVIVESVKGLIVKVKKY